MMREAIEGMLDRLPFGAEPAAEAPAASQPPAGAVAPAAEAQAAPAAGQPPAGDESDSYEKPVIFSFERAQKDTGFEQMEWKLRSTTLEEPISGTKAESLRLVEAKPFDLEETFLPLPSDELNRALSTPTKPPAEWKPGKKLPPGYFDPPGKGLDYCPDIVVFDDLGGTIRHLELSRYGKWDKDSADTRTLQPSIAAWHNPADIESKSTATSENMVAEALVLLLSRLRYAAAPENQTALKRTPLEPIVVCSVTGPPPRLDKVEPMSFWGVLLSDRNLRRRTVVIVDVNDLRDSSYPDGRDRDRSGGSELAISSGLSWESTAQDTIAELRRSPQLRRLLEFSQVVVRFGYCGALHISQRGAREWDYQLYYDPQRDDTTWTDRDKQGVVLGESSLFVASIVSNLTRVCLERKESPVLQDLPTTIGESLPKAIRAVQRLVHLGYQDLEDARDDEDDEDDDEDEEEDEEDEEDEEEDEEDEEEDEDDDEDDEENDDARSLTAFHPQLFAPDPPDPPGTVNLHPIACATIPPLRNRVWSMLSFSTQGRIGQVARQIVRHGVSASLLQQVPTIGDYADAITDLLNGRLNEEENYQKLLRIAPLASGSPPEQVLSQKLKKVLMSAARDAFDALTSLPKEQKEMASKAAIQAVSMMKPLENDRDLVAFWRLRGQERAQFEKFDSEAAQILETLCRRIGVRIRREIEFPFATDPRFAPVTAPVYRLGSQFLVDRREIEGVREVRKLIKLHLDDVATKEKDAKKNPNVNTPLSLAVFGPPGAGKSSIVKAVIGTFEGHVTRPKILDPVNLAQFSSTADLDNAFQKIVDVRAEGRVPIVFFDEFDSRFQEEEWGWLKFFLAPMEDGRYRDKAVHTAVFVFAGGTSPTYADFSQRNRPSTDSQVQAFGRAKGPDFVSRLKGHLDIVGVNPADSDDDLYLIRRAVVVRSILTDIQKLSDTSEAKIDRDILRAILFVPQYRNGARSIKKLIEMCSGSARRLTNGALPPINQLNMVTDGAAFLDLLSNVSAENY